MKTHAHKKAPKDGACQQKALDGKRQAASHGWEGKSKTDGGEGGKDTPSYTHPLLYAIIYPTHKNILGLRCYMQAYTESKEF